MGRLVNTLVADWTPAPDRPDPVAILEAGNQGRQEELIPLRMGRMAASPFAFLRGAAAVMACDLAPSPIFAVKLAEKQRAATAPSSAKPAADKPA